MFITNDTLGIQEISCQTLFETKDTQDFILIDVRQPDEFTGELGHIENSKLITLGPELEEELGRLDQTQSYIFICRSGARSAHATGYAQTLGFNKVYNMLGGMIEWNRLGYPVQY
ncbi:MAG: rhodanese-like domain-containing protein [Bdellovibrionaceae bacterium]|nr:rhodanese-like domain-containing protein [Pseudobdellovibrionaceae bacterium]